MNIRFLKDSLEGNIPSFIIIIGNIISNNNNNNNNNEDNLKTLKLVEIIRKVRKKIKTF